MATRTIYIAAVAAYPRPSRNGKPSQAERVFAVVAANGGRGATKDDVCKALPDVLEKNVSFYLTRLTRDGLFTTMGGRATSSGVKNAPKAANLDEMRVKFLASFEALLVATARANQLNPDADAAFAAYNKVKPAYLGRIESTDGGTANEKAVAFRLAAINAIKALF